MYRGRSKVLVSLLAVLSLISIAAIVDVSDDSSATTDLSSIDLNVTYNGKIVTFNAGDSTAFQFYVKNLNANERILYISASVDSTFIKVSSNAEPISLDGGKGGFIEVKVSAEKYAHQDRYNLVMSFELYDPEDTTNTPQTGTYDFQLQVNSNLSSDKYNKFLGFIPNTLDGMMGETWFAALVSFFGLLAIGYAVMIVAVPLCSLIVMKKDDPERKNLKKLLYRLCHVIVWLWVIGQVARILGLDEGIIDFINRLFYLAYVIVGIIVAWKLWKLIIDTIVNMFPTNIFKAFWTATCCRSSWPRSLSALR